MTQGVSIGLRAVSTAKKNSQINLRKDEFAYVQDYGTILTTAGRVIKTVSLILLLLCISYSVKYYFYSQKIEDVKKKYKIEFLSSFPKMKKNINQIVSLLIG